VEEHIDGEVLGAFIIAQYDKVGITPEKIDPGALILTGVAVRRSNARVIGELFAKEAGKFVSVSAGDALRTTLAAFGSGAAALSIRLDQPVMNVDIGGGTTAADGHFAQQGEVVDITALDVGPELLHSTLSSRFADWRAAKRLAKECGFEIKLGQQLEPIQRQHLVQRMAQKIIEVAKSNALSDATKALLRLDPLLNTYPQVLTFSGGVSEYIYQRQSEHYNDLGPELALEILKALKTEWPQIDLQTPEQGIRATVVGASQYTVQVGGSTIFVEPRHLAT
jgi:ethanolamine utilization protein EutA